MANRTWTNVKLPTGEHGFSFWVKANLSEFDSRSVINSTSSSISLIQGSSSTKLELFGDETDLLVDICDGEWHFIICDLFPSSASKIYVDDSIIPITGPIISVSVLTTEDLVVGDSDLSIFGLNIHNNAINMDSFSDNHIYKDVVENSGNYFYEVI